MHIRDDRVYRFCDVIYPLILRSDVYVGEMDLNPVEIQTERPSYDIKEHFKLSRYFKIRKQLLKSFNIDIEKYAHQHPLMIMSAISNSILAADHAVSLDEHLWNYAKENQLILQGLESMEEQINLLYSIAPGPLYKQIKSISSRPQSIRKFTDKALAYYVRGEIHHLYQLTKSAMHRLRKRIIYQRNAQMVQRMMSFDPSLNYFITVGAGHLSGKNGIISLLRRQGYKVKPVKNFPALKE